MRKDLTSAEEVVDPMCRLPRLALSVKPDSPCTTLVYPLRVFGGLTDIRQVYIVVITR